MSSVEEGDVDDDVDNGEAADAPDLFAWLSREVHELYPHVPHVSGPPTSLSFLRDYVASNRPCVVLGAIDHWPALKKWTPRYLSEVMGDAEVGNGHGERARGDGDTRANFPSTRPVLGGGGRCR